MIRSILASKSYLALLVILAATWIPRGLALDRFVTQDEPLWLTRSANFYQALSQLQFINTYQREHPGVMVTWAGTAGFILRYPGYIKVGPGQMKRPPRLSAFLSQHEFRTVDILEAGRAVMVLWIVTALAIAFLYGSRMAGWFPALLGFTLIAFDPYLTGLSRLLHLDGLVSALMLLSLAAFLSYQFHGRRKIDLLLSGVAAGLSWLTKSPAFFLIPFIGLLVLVELLQRWLSARRWSFRDIGKSALPVLAWIGVAALIFCLLWPAMWVDPIGSLKGVVSMATSYSTEGHSTNTFFNGRIYTGSESAWYFYPVSFVWRTSPVVLAGLALAIFFLVFRRRLAFPKDQFRLVYIFGLFAILYTLFISLGAKKFDRYLLPVYAPLDLIAALGWYRLIHWIESRLTASGSLIRALPAAAALGVLAAIQLTGMIHTYPYYLNYFNPLLGGAQKASTVMMVGWGEGLDQAASYLNALPGAKRLKVISWCGEGCFSYFFEGLTLEMEWDITTAELEKVDYAVLYINQLQRQLPSAEVLAYFEELTPVHTVRIDNQDYALVYKLR